MAKKQLKNTPRIEYRINDEIDFYGQVRVVGENANNEVMSIDKARKLAESLDLDLVEINSRVTPPIMKVCNYEKMVYELKKALKKNRQQAKPPKEIQLSVNIAENDLKTKENQARKFIEDGFKVKVILIMKGRELSRRMENKKTIFKFIADLEDVAAAESLPKDEGTRTIVFLKRKTKQQ